MVRQFDCMRGYAGVCDSYLSSIDVVCLNAQNKRPCDMLCCTYRYIGLADGEEVAFASSIALQAYYEQRKLTRDDMDKCLDYWRNNISQRTSGRKRDVCCEPYCVPCCTFERLYTSCTHCKRNIPYGGDDPRNTKELQQVRLCFSCYFYP